MQISRKLAALAILAAASANPLSSALTALNSASILASSIECAAINTIVNTLHAYPSATPFCSSFLSIPTITSTVITTSTSVIPTIQTTTTGTTTSTSTTTATVTSSATVTTCTIASGGPSSLIGSGGPSSLIGSGGPSSLLARNAPPATTSKPNTSTTLKITSSTMVPYTNTTSGKPTQTLPSCVSSFQSAQISTACKCLGIPTPTSTTTSTVQTTTTSTTITSVAATTTVTATATAVTNNTATIQSCPAPTLCGNQGLQWAYYRNINGDNPSIGSGYPNFSPENYKTQNPQYTSTTNSIGGFDYPAQNTPISIYGFPAKLSSDYFVLNHRGYIFAQTTGTYTFSLNNVDDSAFVWVGAKAKQSWARSNDDLDVSIGPGQGSFTYSLTAGQYLPVRIMFAQGQLAAVFKMSITAPDGTVFLDSSTNGSPYLVQYSCDGTSAPPYAQPFGAEV